MREVEAVQVVEDAMREAQGIVDIFMGDSEDACALGAGELSTGG